MKKEFLIILLLLAIVFAAATLFTYAEFGSLNPAATAVGLVQVCVSDEPYVQTGYLEKAYVAQSEGGLDLFIHTMEDWGYTHLPDEQLGSVYFFLDSAGQRQPVRFQQNAHFAKWIWY